MGSGASMAKESELDEDKAKRLAQKCVSKFTTKGLPQLPDIVSVSPSQIQELWTGMGAVEEVMVRSSKGSSCAIIIKHVGLPKDLDDAAIKRNHGSYSVEASFYEKGHAEKLFEAGALCPRYLFTEKKEDLLSICMTKLQGEEFDGSEPQHIRAALSWLATMHAVYWGASRVQQALRTGLWKQGSFWYLDARPGEFEVLSQSKEDVEQRLFKAARAIDERLKADKMQTICHGDAKPANIFWEKGDVASMFDFQWSGKAPPSKDLAYFLSCAARDISDEEEEEYLRFYLKELSVRLKKQHDECPSFEDIRDSYSLACADLARWMAGYQWYGNKALLERHIEAVLDKLDGGDELDTCEAYAAAIRKEFPVRVPCAAAPLAKQAGKLETQDAQAGEADTASTVASESLRGA
eukprot:TRINITY_DN30945_c0_g1_i1.p1 TRINITY_DN30945_c0_g1~~TRINITY_DN30945_c0_g1_i1.p1  ORF type:complete len:408 (+),score=120.95 TRINITY_DN30945_c0_g1_i1:88-1311(+)